MSSLRRQGTRSLGLRAGTAAVVVALVLAVAAAAASPASSTASASAAPSRSTAVFIRLSSGSWKPFPEAWGPLFGKRITFQAAFFLADSELDRGADTVALVEAARCTVYYTRGWTRLVRSQVVPARVAPSARGPGQGTVTCAYVLRKDVAGLWMAVNPALKYGGTWYSKAKDQRGGLLRTQLTRR
jgi:hypothetical protein